MVMVYSIQGFCSQWAAPMKLFCCQNNRPTMNSVDEGVGRPKKPVVWRVSMLNFAKRRAEKSVSMNAGAARLRVACDPHACCNSWKSTMPGTNPKETISAKESNWTPKGELDLSHRATIPSRKSAVAAMMTQ